MRRESLSDLCCPVCRQALDVVETGCQSDNIVEGELRCVGCGSNYPIQKGIPHLLLEKALKHGKIQEMEGWPILWQRRGLYDSPPQYDHLQLPYLGGCWAETAAMFDLALQEMNLQGHEVILDLGAGQGWASRYFAEKGCQVFAVDMVADELLGLGRSWALMKDAGVYFEPLLADGEAMPFFADRFDVVFLCGTLHHFEEFDGVLNEVLRILKPGGRFIATSEPAIPLFLRERDAQAPLEEIEAGLTERRPKVFEYWWALRKAGFKDLCIDTDESYKASPSDIYAWITSIRDHLCQVVRPWMRPLVWLALGSIRALPHRWGREVMLQIYGGGLLIRGIKPTH